MKLYYTTMLLLASLLPITVLATPAQNCKTLSCVRKNIDIIDQQMVKLIGQRLTYVKRAGELKGHKIPVYDPAREKVILDTVGQQAEKQGYPASIAQDVFKTILNQSRTYEEKSQH